MIRPHHAYHKHEFEYCDCCFKRFGDPQVLETHRITCISHTCVTWSCPHFSHPMGNGCRLHHRKNTQFHIWRYLHILACVRPPPCPTTQEPSSPSYSDVATSIQSLTQAFESPSTRQPRPWGSQASTLEPHLPATYSQSPTQTRIRALVALNTTLLRQYRNPNSDRLAHVEQRYALEMGTSLNQNAVQNEDELSVQWLEQIARQLRDAIHSGTLTRMIDLQPIVEAIPGASPEGELASPAVTQPTTQYNTNTLGSAAAQVDSQHQFNPAVSASAQNGQQPLGEDVFDNTGWATLPNNGFPSNYEFSGPSTPSFPNLTNLSYVLDPLYGSASPSAGPPTSVSPEILADPGTAPSWSPLIPDIDRSNRPYTEQLDQNGKHERSACLTGTCMA